MSRSGVIRLVVALAVFAVVGVGVYLRSTRGRESAAPSADSLTGARASGKVVVAHFGRGI